MDVTFFLHGEPHLEALKRLDPDRDHREFQTGERVWILQTCLRPRAAGHAIELRDCWPRCGLLLFDARQKHELRRLFREPALYLALVEMDGLAFPCHPQAVRTPSSRH